MASTTTTAKLERPAACMICMNNFEECDEMKCCEVCTFTCCVECFAEWKQTIKYPNNPQKPECPQCKTKSYFGKKPTENVDVVRTRRIAYFGHQHPQPHPQQSDQFIANKYKKPNTEPNVESPINKFYEFNNGKVYYNGVLITQSEAVNQLFEIAKTQRVIHPINTFVIYNPDTGRWVNEFGPVGKKISQKYNYDYMMNFPNQLYSLNEDGKISAIWYKDTLTGLSIKCDLANGPYKCPYAIKMMEVFDNNPPQ